MAPRKKATTEPEFDANMMPPGPNDPLTDFFNQYPNANRKFKVGRYDGAQIIHLFSTSDMIDEDALQDQYPEGGRFVIRAYEENTLRGSTEIRIGPKPGTAPPPPIQETNPKVEASNPGDMSEMSFLKQLVLKVVGMGPGIAPQQVTPVNELAEALKTIHSMNPQGSGNASKEYAEGLKAGIDLAKNLTRESTGDWKSELFATIRESLPGIAAALPAMVNRGTPPPVPTPTKTTETTIIQADPMDKILYDGIQRLKPMCLSGTDVGLIIDFTLANAQQPQYADFIRATFNRDFDAIASLDPEIGKPPFREWFESLYNGLRQAFNEAGKLDDGGDGGDGDEGNTTHNAESRPNGRKGA